MPYLVDDSEYERSYPGIRRGPLTVKESDREASHSRTRLATSKSGVEAFVPCSDTATSNINFSSSRGRYGPREFLQDIKIIGRSRIS